MTTQYSLSRVISHEENKPVLNKLIYYSLMMVTLPVGTFLALYFFVASPLFNIAAQRLPSDNEKVVWSAGAAVLTVNVILFSYVVSAFREDVGIKGTKGE
mmetsp:Transcript_866/g.1365  ORF Transcript_866/g.1365 Transcript_866/m.1365 type:complete len:100 (+) Transcript_866:111-410(+)